jgi:hypothetical protein
VPHTVNTQALNEPRNDHTGQRMTDNYNRTVPIRAYPLEDLVCQGLRADFMGQRRQVAWNPSPSGHIHRERVNIGQQYTGDRDSLVPASAGMNPAVNEHKSGGLHTASATRAGSHEARGRSSFRNVQQ